MNPDQTKSLIRSRTTIWALSALLAYLIKLFGLPMLPADVNSELISVIQLVLEAFIPLAILMAIWFRRQATAIIDRVF